SVAPFLSVPQLLQYLRRRLINHLNAGEIRQAPDLLGQCAVCPLHNFLKAFGICGVFHYCRFAPSPRHAPVLRVAGQKPPAIFLDHSCNLLLRRRRSARARPRGLSIFGPKARRLRTSMCRTFDSWPFERLILRLEKRLILGDRLGCQGECRFSAYKRAFSRKVPASITPLTPRRAIPRAEPRASSLRASPGLW